MKKILYLISLFLFFIIPVNTFALSFVDKNGIEKDLNADTWAEYCYITYGKNYPNFMVTHFYNNSTGVDWYYCDMFKDLNYIYDYDGNGSYNRLYYVNNDTTDKTFSRIYTKNFNEIISNFSLQSNPIGVNDIEYFKHNFDIFSNVSHSIIGKNSNLDTSIFEKQEENTNINFPITKDEFYSLLVLVGTLIMMLFLKWCYPFKMGGNLK